MIESLTLENWKSVEFASHKFKPGINFILGPNGSGKTSVLEGIVFALFGLTKGADPVDCIRYGAERAQASVGIAMEGIDAISRSIDSGGKVTVTLTRDLQADESRDASEVVESSFGANAALLVNLILLAEGDIYRYGHQRQESLETHLSRILPIEQVDRLRNQAEAAMRKAAAPQRQMREFQRTTCAEIEKRRRALDDASNELDALSVELEAASRRLEPLISNLRQAELRAAQEKEYRSWLQLWDRETDGVDFQSDVSEPDDILEGLQRRLESKLEELREATNTRSHLSGEQAHIRRIVQSLETSRDSCPTCGQAMIDELHRGVLQDHIELVQLTVEEIDKADRVVDEIKQSLEDLRANLTRLRGLLARRPSRPQGPTYDVESLAQELDKERDAEARVRTRYFAAQEEVATLRAEIEQAERSWILESEIIDAFRQEALWKTLSDGLDAFISDARNSVIQPLVDEISRQWKTFRPDAPWTLDVDQEGHICMVFEGRSYPFSALSGGEKAAALVLLRVALTRALTDVDFMMFDEPLEHMDSRSRRLLLSSLDQVVRKGMFNQILVTTYEEQLVRRFVRSDQAHALYLD